MAHNPLRPILSRLLLLFLGLALVAVGGHARPMVGAAGATPQSSNPSPLLAAGAHQGALPLSHNDLGSRPRLLQSLTHGSHRSLLNQSGSESYAIAVAIGSPMNSSCMLCNGLSQIVWDLISLLGAPWAQPTPSPPPPQTQEYDPFGSFRGSAPSPSSSSPAPAPPGAEGEGDTLQQSAVNVIAPLTPTINTTAANSSAANTSTPIPTTQTSADNTTVLHTTAINATAPNTTTTDDTSETILAANITDGSTTAGNTSDLNGPLIQAMDGKTDVHTGVSNRNTTVVASNSVGDLSTATGSRNSSVGNTDGLKSSNNSLAGNSAGSLTIVLTIGPTTNATNVTTEGTKMWMDELVNKTQDLAYKIGKQIKSAMQSMSESFMKASERINPAMETAGDSVEEAFGTAGGWLRDGLEGIGNEVGGWLDDVGTWFDERITPQRAQTSPQLLSATMLTPDH